MGCDPLPVNSQTSFPKLAASITQLKQAANQGFCDVPAQEAQEIIIRLEDLNASEVSVRGAFDGLTEFRLTAERPKKGDYLGLSRVYFTNDHRAAYLNLDIGGDSGSIVQMRLEDGDWRMTGECAGWISW